MYTTILTLHKQGITQRQIAKITNTHRQTVKKMISRYETAKIETPIPYTRICKIAPWHQNIIELLGSNLSVVRMHEELVIQGFEESYGSLSRYIRKHNIKHNTCIRFHTLAGEEAQVDFGYVGKRYDNLGRLRKAYVFNLRLSFSRLDYYEVVFDQKVATWIQCHINAFNSFGGVPKTIKLDNLRAGVLDANIYEPLFQKEYKRFADHYGCLLSPCRPYKPQEKGKVESGIKYVKNNFFAGRNFKTFEEMSLKLDKWLLLANQRIHGTTKISPLELYNSSEATSMLELPALAFEMSSWHERKVAKDCHITLDNNYYSVPAKYVGETVLISVSYQMIKVFANDNIIATHARSKKVGIFTTLSSHYSNSKTFCPGFEKYDQKQQEQIQQMGSSCSAMLDHIKKHQKDWYRTAKGIINLRKLYADEIIDKACHRALHYNISNYSKIKNIIETNSYILPLGESLGGSYAHVA